MKYSDLPDEIIDYIWSFDNTKYNNFDKCINKIKYLYRTFEKVKRIYISCNNNNYYNHNLNSCTWWLNEFGDFSGKYILKKIREHNSFKNIKEQY